jgi:hypothetical protein
MSPPRTQLTVAEAAVQLRGILSKRTIQFRVKTGEIPATKLPGVTAPYLIDQVVVETLIAQAKAKADALALRQTQRAA